MADNIIKSLQKAVNIIDYLASEGEKGVTEVSKHFKISKSGAYNILHTLELNHLIQKNETNDKYHLGIRLFELGNIVRSRFELRKIALKHMEEIVSKTNETVHLTIFNDKEIIYVESAQPENKLAFSPVIGRRVHMHCTGVGKAILAYQPENVIDSIIQQGELPRFTPNTITDPEKLKEHLKEIRERGYSIDDIEHEFGVRCVGAPIRNEKGEVFASMSITGPSPRFPDNKIDEYSKLLMEVTNKISRQLGWSG